MKRKPPKGYDSWIEVYDTVMNQNPELLLSKSIWFTYYDNPIAKPEVRFGIVINSPKLFKVQIKTLLASCFLELLDLRMNDDETKIVVHRMKKYDDNFHKEWTDKATKLLYHLKITE